MKSIDAAGLILDGAYLNMTDVISQFVKIVNTDKADLTSAGWTSSVQIVKINIA